MEARQTKSLNVDEAVRQMETLGYSQRKLADEIGVSKEAVSQWFKNEKFPNPAHLLVLAKKLELPFGRLVIKSQSESEPIIAFRKKAHHDITPEYISKAKENGLFLELLVQHLPYENLYQPATLLNPKNDYEYIQEVVKQIRAELNLSCEQKLAIPSLIGHFNKLHATLIPVFLGHKEAHENALHIFLPKTKSTWIYLNLDSYLCDFKFWMAHELGHILSPNLAGDESEDFADAFAGAMLVGQEVAEKIYFDLKRKSFNVGVQVNHIKDLARDLMVSPFTIFKEVNKFTAFANLEPIKISSIHAVTKNFEKECPSVSQFLFQSGMPNPTKYINTVTDAFKTPFFKALKDHLIDTRKGASFIHKILYLPLVDSHQFYEEICRWEPSNT